MSTTEKQHAHELLERVPADQEDEEISEEEEAAVARSREWFKHNEGIPFEQVVADLGFTMDEIRSKDPLS